MHESEVFFVLWVNTVSDNINMRLDIFGDSHCMLLARHPSFSLIMAPLPELHGTKVTIHYVF